MLTRRNSTLLAASAVAVIAAGTIVLLAHSSPKAPSLPVVASSVAPSAPPQAVSPATTTAAGVVPTRVIIPSIGVNAPVMSLGLCPTSRTDEDCNGVKANGLATPVLSASNLAGWWSGGPKPGAVGPAVIAGHIDNPNPAVFWNIAQGKLVAGATIEIEPGNLWFTVTGTQQISKDSFPTSQVYCDGAPLTASGACSVAPHNGPELRLITCSGSFTAGHYTDNFIVYATLAHASG